MSAPVWSDLHLNYITHYGDINSFRRSTITIDVIGKVYTLSKWYKGCGFSPDTVKYPTMNAAIEAGEVWYNKGV